MCDGQWSLTFDPYIVYPVAPVCDWPINLDCGETLVGVQCCKEDFSKIFKFSRDDFSRVIGIYFMSTL